MKICIEVAKEIFRFSLSILVTLFVILLCIEGADYFYLRSERVAIFIALYLGVGKQVDVIFFEDK